MISWSCATSDKRAQFARWHLSIATLNWAFHFMAPTPKWDSEFRGLSSHLSPPCNLCLWSTGGRVVKERIIKLSVSTIWAWKAYVYPQEKSYCELFNCNRVCWFFIVPLPICGWANWFSKNVCLICHEIGLLKMHTRAQKHEYISFSSDD